jgi:cation:H+ antiporter
MTNYSFFTIVGIFLIAAIATWIAGVSLAKSTDTLDTRYKIGNALGGLILLGIAGTLPEIAVVVSAAKAGHFPVITGNLIGGLAIQTLVIIFFDFALKKKKSLSYLSGSFLMSLETLFAIVLTIITLIGIIFKTKYSVSFFSPYSIILVVVWIYGLFLINRERKIQRFNITEEDAEPGRLHHERRAVENHKFFIGKSNFHVIILFIIAAIITLISGFFLERTGNIIAIHFGIGSGIFAGTVIAFVTSLPEISTGLESIKIGDNQLAISDIMGGNAFMLTVFLLADLVAKKPVLTFASHADLVMGISAVVMMGIYAISFLTRPKKKYFRLGPDSILEIIIYAATIFVLTII